MMHLMLSNDVSILVICMDALRCIDVHFHMQIVNKKQVRTNNINRKRNKHV